MKLFFSRGACSLTCRIIINELGLPCEYESVDLAKKITAHGKNHFEINPKGAVPVLITDDNQTLTENAIILQYLADSNKAENLLPFVANFQRYRVLEWLNYVATELHKGFGPLFNQNVPQETKDAIFIPLMKKKLEYINNHLADSQYLCGDHFTLPDAYLFVVLRWAVYFKFDLQPLPNLSRLFSELSHRKSIQQSLQEEGIKM